MAYVIDFIGCKSVEKDYDAIAFRFWDGKRYINCVFDGGTKGVAPSMISHLKTYYECDGRVVLDYVFCSHADGDHANGLVDLITEFEVRNLVVNVPWDYNKELFEYAKYDQTTRDSLIRKLKDEYSNIDELIETSKKKGVNILTGVVGTKLPAGLRILSPTKDDYVQHICSSQKTSLLEIKEDASQESFSTGKYPVQAEWDKDGFPEDGNNSSENETSVILEGCFGKSEHFILLGDAGAESINGALDVANKEIPLEFVQVPHHGGRHNLTTAVANKLLGQMLPQKLEEHNRCGTAFVSVAHNSTEYPTRCVVNAFMRRGWYVYVSRGNTIMHWRGADPKRNWKTISPEEYSPQIEG